MAGYEQQHDYDAASGADEQEREARTGKVEPTTVELFATIADGLCDYAGPRDTCLARYGERCPGCAALSELKRRMGAMARAIQDAPHGETCMVGRSALVKECTCWKSRALTDAPPVVTVEEVRAIIDEAVDTTRDHILSALRSTGGGR